MGIERQFVLIQPGMWMAWLLADEGWFLAQIHQRVFEIPTGGRLIGCWSEKPSVEDQMEALSISAFSN